MYATAVRAHSSTLNLLMANAKCVYTFQNVYHFPWLVYSMYMRCQRCWCRRRYRRHHHHRCRHCDGRTAPTVGCLGISLSLTHSLFARFSAVSVRLRLSVYGQIHIVNKRDRRISTVPKSSFSWLFSLFPLAPISRHRNTHTHTHTVSSTQFSISALFAFSYIFANATCSFRASGTFDFFLLLLLEQVFDFANASLRTIWLRRTVKSWIAWGTECTIKFVSN